MDNPILEIKDLEKHYGRKKALDGVSLTVYPGRIVGLMGPNGSGKSTMLKLIAGLLRPRRGEIKVCGCPIGIKSKALVSYLHDSNPLFAWMRAADAVAYYADFFTDFDTARAYEMLDFMKLDKNQKVRAMSKGMAEKLNLTLTFARAAKLYLMDEPLGGIDPLARQKIVSTIIQTFRPDAAIMISTHLLNDIENLFNDVVFIREGKVLLQGDATELRAQYQMNTEQLYIKLFSEAEEQA